MVVAVISGATMVAAGRPSPGDGARADRSGTLAVRAGVVAAGRRRRGGTAQIAPIIVEAYGLTPREQDITQAVARGLANQDIAPALHDIDPAQLHGGF